MFIDIENVCDEYTYFAIHTLIDITKHNRNSSNYNSNDQLKRNQQRNWETFVQTCNLRTQTFDISNPARNHSAVDNIFGMNYTGKHLVWSFYFGVEQPAYLESATSAYGALREDLHGVPIVTGLNETIKFDVPIIQTIGTYTNTIIEKLNSKQQ